MPLLLLAAAAALSACGLKTPPQPLSEVLPAPGRVHAWQREETVIVAWEAPSPDTQKQYGGLRGYSLWLRTLPLLCPQCPPESPVRMRLNADDPKLHSEAGQMFYPLPLGADVGQLSVRVSTRFGAGQGPDSPVVQVMRAGSIPAPALRWRWAPRSEGGGAHVVQFYWKAVQERIVQVIGTDAVPREHVLDYRANLYRRVPPGSWPMLPLNPAPVAATQLAVPTLSPGGQGERYELRYVDQFGNEGPPSAEVRLHPPEPAPSSEPTQ